MLDSDVCIVDCNWLEDGIELGSDGDGDNLAARYIRTRPPTLEPGSPANMRKLRKLLRECYKDHATCRSRRQESAANTLPKYLLYLGSSSPNRLYLVDTANLKETVRDAVAVARQAGVQYLFVDALCILQDQGQSIEADLADLPALYAKADLVIDAASAAHSDAGFLQTRHPHREYEIPVVLTTKNAAERDRIRLIERVANGDEPTDTRCWTFQEQHNAIATARFTTDYFEWRCQEKEYQDSDIHELWDDDEWVFPASYFDGSIVLCRMAQDQELDASDHLTAWLNMTCKYSRRDIRSRDDKLYALASAAETFASVVGYGPSEYKAGCWMQDLHRQILWKRDVYRYRDRAARPLAETETSLPSWAWPSSQSAISWFDDDLALDWKDYTLDIMQCEVALVDPTKPFEHVRGGKLTVNGYFRDAYWDGDVVVEIARHEDTEAKISGFCCKWSTTPEHDCNTGLRDNVGYSAKAKAATHQVLGGPRGDGNPS
ncbi:hypothetical protein MRS44_013270 [Fusarium solani]|uniref:uncharacterized protein n=1 Tax=Fusarium solani TaxID=169388 RepID=UPI0032C47827|nr:hypothetical protein MRS44_013270 [Fusarium solani]